MPGSLLQKRPTETFSEKTCKFSELTALFKKRHPAYNEILWQSEPLLPLKSVFKNSQVYDANEPNVVWDSFYNMSESKF